MEAFYDMHCHLGFTPDPSQTAAEGADADLHAFSCTVTPTEYEQLAPLLTDSPNVRVGLGAHPWWIADGRIDAVALDEFCQLAQQTRFVGEIGLDFAGDRDTEQSRHIQTAALERILGACSQPGKLISVHAVNAATSALDILEATDAPARHHVVFHWFSGTSDDLKRAIDLGCYFSIGSRMLASRRGREYARQLPLERIVLETDAPAREGKPLPAATWHAELNNALAGIAQLKQIDPARALETINQTSMQLLGIR